MAIINSEERTKLLRKVQDSVLDYEALKLPVSELRVDNTTNTVFTNPVLIPDSSNVCTWEHSINSPAVFVQLQEVSTKNTVLAPHTVDITVENNVTSYTLKIFIKSSSTISADTYEATIIG